MISILSLAMSSLASEPSAPLPGKGLSFQEGQFAEYRSLVAVDGRTNEIMRTRFLVLDQSTEHQGMERVAVLSFAREKLVKRQVLLYDPAREPQNEGKLTSSSKEKLQVGKRRLACIKEKRVSENGSATTWTSKDVPISGVVRNEISSNGKTLISELVLYGPEGLASSEISAFMDAMNPLKQPSEPLKEP